MLAGRLMRSTARRRPRPEGGAVAVEFALVLLPLLLVIFGIVQYGFYFMASQSASNVARDLARRVAVGDCPNQAELESYADGRLGAINQGALDVDREYKKVDGTSTTFAGRSVGDQVVITVTFRTIDLNFPFLPLPNDSSGNIVVSKQSDVRLEDMTSDGVCT